ncbi:MAG: DUF4838 domain-containing protein [Planctomycetota bacterium]|jgi:hypothetical protein
MFKKSNLMYFLFGAVLILFAAGLRSANPPRLEKTDKGEGFQLAKNGKTDAIIVIPADADVVTSFAASQLQHYVEKITGARLPIKKKPHGTNAKLTIQFQLQSDPALVYDAFRIETSKSRILLTAAKTRGLLYAVYTILEDVGCAFVYPGEDEEIIPKTDSLAVPLGRRTLTPAIEHRGLTFYGLQASSVELGRKIIDWMAKNRLNLVMPSEDRPSDCPGPAHASLWYQVGDELLPEVQKRGFVIDMSEHSTHVFFPRSLFAEHPEWYALNDGVRKLGQMCYANAEGIEYYANAQADYAAKHPEIQMLGTWPLDGGGYCQCQVCSNPETVFKAITRVAQKVRQVRPDLTVEHLAYKRQTWEVPKTVKVPENVSILFCPSDRNELARDWVEAAKSARGVYFFEYKTGDNYHFMANVWLRPEFAKNLVDYAEDIGYRGLISLYLPVENWWRNSFNTWFFARTCWYRDLDVETEMEKYCRQYYGRHAKVVNEIFRIIFSELQNEKLHASHNALGGRNGTPVNPEALARTQAAAETILKKLADIQRETTDPAVIKRLDRIEIFVRYFRLYYQVYHSQSKSQLKRLVEFSRQNSKFQDGVLMYPEYIWWRNSGYYKKD